MLFQENTPEGKTLQNQGGILENKSIDCFFFLLKTNCQVLSSQTEFIIHVFFFFLGFFQLVEPDEKGTPTHAMQEHTCVHTAQMHTQSPLGNILYDSCCNVTVQWEHSIGCVDIRFHLGCR